MMSQLPARTLTPRKTNTFWCYYLQKTQENENLLNEVLVEQIRCCKISNNIYWQDGGVESGAPNHNQHSLETQRVGY